MKKVLEILQQHQLYANQKKCEFGSSRLEYLGHVITLEGVAADPAKISAMVKWSRPENIRDLRGFLGLTGYYQRFILNYGSIAWPLTDLLKKDQFQWGKAAKETFERLKVAMTSVPMLVLSNFNEVFVVESDASGVGLGAVLMQNKQPLAYFSRALTDCEKEKSIYERELMVIVLTIQKW